MAKLGSHLPLLSPRPIDQTVCNLAPLFRITFFIENVCTLALVDTGCPASLLSVTLFAQLDDCFQRKERTEPLATFRNASGMPMYSQGQFDLNVRLQNRHVFQHPFHVIPNLTEPCILGLDFLTKNKFTFVGA